MTRLIAGTLAALLLTGCPAAKTNETSAVATAASETTETTQPVAPATASEGEATETETWSGQIKVAQPVSTLNYVGAESGDWVPMRFHNDSEAGKKILSACSNDDLCEFTGTVRFLDEAPPPDASAVAEIISIDSVKRLPPETR